MTPDNLARRPLVLRGFQSRARSGSRTPRRSRTHRDFPSADRLTHIARVLARVIVIFQQLRSAERDHLVSIARAARATLHTTTQTLRSRSRDGVPLVPERLNAWFHEIGGPLTVVAGWAVMLSPSIDTARHTLAIEAIELNARRLTELLGQPPI